MASYLDSYRKLAGLTEATLGSDDRDPQKFVKERVYFTYKGDKYETILTKHGDIELYKFDGATPMFQDYVKTKVTGAFGVAKLIIDNRRGKFDKKIANRMARNVKKTVKMPPDTNVFVTNTPPRGGYDGKGIRPGTLYILLGRPRHEQEEGKWLANYVHQGGRSTSGHYYDTPEEAARLGNDLTPLGGARGRPGIASNLATDLDPVPDVIVAPAAPVARDEDAVRRYAA